MKSRNPWWVVFAAVMGLIVGNGPLMQFSFGVFLKPLTEEFHSDRATISAAVLAGLVLTGLFTPFAGRLVDRHGVRAVALPGIVLFALAMASLALSPASPYPFIALYGLTGIIAAGQTPLPYAKAVAGAFEHRRGLALGAEVDLIAYLISRYLGMKAFGEIYGYLFAIFLLGSGLGPFLMGLSFTKTGSYGTAIVAFGIGLVVASALILFFGPYRYTASKELAH